MTLEKIAQDRPRLADIVYKQILSAIRSGAIDPAERLVQTKLAEQMHISRTPVREALLRLEQDGILMSSSRGGFTIRRMSNDEVRELYQARAAIEGQAVRILAARSQTKTNQALRSKIEKEERISSPSVETYFEANRRIHRYLVELSGNRYLIEMFDNIWNRGSTYNLFAAIEKIDLSQSLGYHTRLVDAIETGDPTTAMEAAVDHIYQGLELQLAALGRC